MSAAENQSNHKEPTRSPPIWQTGWNVWKLHGTRLIDGRSKSNDFAINKKHQCQRANRSYRVIAMKHNELARFEDNGAHGKSPENYFVLDLRIATQRMPSVFASAASSNPDQLTFGQALSAGEAGSRGRNSLQGIGAKPTERPGREWPDSGLPDHSPATLAQAWGANLSRLSSSDRCTACRTRWKEHPSFSPRSQEQ